MRRPRRGTLCIRIRADNRIEVLAPSHVSRADISRFVISKSQWIQNKQAFNRDIRTQYQAKRFIDGESFKLLGHDCTLQLTCSQDARVVSGPGQLQVLLPDIGNREAVRQLVESWYRQQAQNILENLCASYSRDIGVQAASVGIKNYRSRWGSCHHDGRIYFNWRIIMAPEAVVRYVVVHELCHLLHANHSRAYWQTVESFMPDYKQSNAWLKIHGLGLDL
ncbi:MAG: SprT family zinc-dependent metalloprotease [Mariprofundaceae bacterium]